MPIYWPAMTHRIERLLPDTRSDVSMRELIAYYKVFSFDSYGVMRGRTGHFLWAERTLREVLAQGKKMMIASNTAADLPEDIQAGWQQKGVNIPIELIVTSGMVLKSFVQENDLEDAPAIVLGTNVSRQYAEQAGLIPIQPKNAMRTYQQAEAVILCENPPGGDETLDAAVNAILAKKVPYVQTTTDRFVPFFHDRDFNGVSVGVSYTARGITGLTGIEPIIIGKPAQGMFNIIKKALTEMGYAIEDVLFVGDNLYEDGLGALMAGFAFLLVESGISGMVTKGQITGPVAELDAQLLAQGIKPTYRLPSIALGS